jgi:transposase InsO family protein
MGSAAAGPGTGATNPSNDTNYLETSTSQFTSTSFTDVLLKAGIAISMDGKGSWRDNVFVERLWRSVKYEEVV